MENFDNILKLAQNGDKNAMEKLIFEYKNLINNLVYKMDKRVDKEDFRQYLIIKFIENTKNLM